MYHVQYFGPKPYHGWTTKNKVMHYEGFKKFDDNVNEEMENSNGDQKKKDKVIKKWGVKEGDEEREWNESIAEAELAMKLNPEKRVQDLTLHYFVNKKKRLCFEDSSDDTSSCNAASVDDVDPAEVDRFCFECNGEDDTPADKLVTCQVACLRMLHAGCGKITKQEGLSLCNECKDSK